MDKVPPDGHLDGGAVGAPGRGQGPLSYEIQVRMVRVEPDFSVLAPPTRVSDVLGDLGGVPVKPDAAAAVNRVPVKPDAPQAVNRAPDSGGDMPLTDAKAPAAGGPRVDLPDDPVPSEPPPGYPTAAKDPPPEFLDVLKLAQKGEVPVGGFRDLVDWRPAPGRGGDPVAGAGGSVRPPSDVGAPPGAARPGEGPASVPARAEIDPLLAGSRPDLDPGFTGAKAGEVRLPEPVTPRDLAGGGPSEHWQDAVVRRMDEIVAERQQMVEEGIQAQAQAAVAGPDGRPGGPGHGPDVPPRPGERPAGGGTPPPGERPAAVADNSLGLDEQRLAHGALVYDVQMHEWLAAGGHTVPAPYRGTASAGAAPAVEHLHAQRADLAGQRQEIVRQAAGGPLSQADTTQIAKIDRQIRRLDQKLGFAGPARALDHVIHQRRILLADQAQRPATGAGAAPPEQIRSRLDELTTQERGLISQLRQRLGEPPAIDTTPRSFAAGAVPSRADIERELAKVQRLREDILGGRDAPVRSPEQSMARGGPLAEADTTPVGQTPGRPDDPRSQSGVDQPGPKPLTLSDAEAHETKLLDQARRLQEHLDQEQLADIKRRAPDLTAQRDGALTRYLAAKAGDPAVTPASEARAQMHDAATEYVRIDRQLSNMRKSAALIRQELADPGRPAPQWSITAGTSSRLGAGPAVHGALPPTVIDQHGAPSAGSVPKAEAGSVPKAEAGSVVDGHTRSVSDSATTDDTRAMTAGELSGKQASPVAGWRGGDGSSDVPPGLARDWARGQHGWLVSQRDTVLGGPRWKDGGPPVVVAAGSKAVTDGSGQLVHVVAEDGVSHELGPGGRWGPARQEPGEVQHVKLLEPTTLESEGKVTAVLQPGDEVVKDSNQEVVRGEGQVLGEGGDGKGVAVAYRQVLAGDGTRLAQPRTFAGDGKGGWVETGSPVDSPWYQGWLASANKDHESALLLFDLAARPGLAGLDKAGLRDLLHSGSPGDRKAAVFEIIRRGNPGEGVEGMDMRWTQVQGFRAMDESTPGGVGDGNRGPVLVNMDAGEGKTLVYAADLAYQALRNPVKYLTDGPNLADRDAEEFRNLLSPYGYRVVRINSSKQEPPPRDGKPTIYVGEVKDDAFGWLHNEQDMVPGQAGSGAAMRLVVDEFDGMVYNQAHFIITKGALELADPQTTALVRWGQDFLTRHLPAGVLPKSASQLLPGEVRSGHLMTPWQRLSSLDASDAAERFTAADFDHLKNGGTTTLNEQGWAKAGQLLEKESGTPLNDDQARQLEMAVTANFDLLSGRHYNAYLPDKKVYIITPNGVVLKNHDVEIGTTTESRWFRLHPALEAKEGFPIHADQNPEKSITAPELFNKPVYQKGGFSGASGTVVGHEEHFASLGLGEVKTVKIPRYYEGQLKVEADDVSPGLATKLNKMAGDIVTMWDHGQGRPQLVVVHEDDLVAEIASRLDERGMQDQYTAIDTTWNLDHLSDIEAQFKNVIRHAGEQGNVLVINDQGGRGVNIKLTPEAKAAGYLYVRVSGHSELGPAPDIQVVNRAARSGDLGTAKFYTSPQDPVYQHSSNREVPIVITRYNNALAGSTATPHTADTTIAPGTPAISHDTTTPATSEAATSEASTSEASTPDATTTTSSREALEALDQAVKDLRKIIPGLQAEGAFRLAGRLRPSYHANAPPPPPPPPPPPRPRPTPTGSSRAAPPWRRRRPPPPATTSPPATISPPATMGR